MVKHRNIFVVYLLMIITFGLYGIYWAVSTKNEFNSLGAKVPTAWLIIIPLVNIYWYFKYIQGFTQNVKEGASTALWFILSIIPGVNLIVPGVIQSELNKRAASATPTQQTVPAKAAPVAPAQAAPTAQPQAATAQQPATQPANPAPAQPQ